VSERAGDRPHRGIDGIGVASVDHHPRAEVGEQPRDREADAARPTDDDRGTPRQR
jgi:hypothetical protein